MRYLITVFLASAISGTSAQGSGSIAGTIHLAIGSNEIVNADGERTRAERLTKIAAGDTLITGDDGILHISFSDGSLVSLRCNSSLQVLPSTANTEPNQLLLEIGHLRAISSSLHSNGLEVHTVFAIGETLSQGSDFEVITNQQGTSIFRIIAGPVNIRNELGLVNIGEGRNFDYAIVDEHSSPRGVSAASSIFPSTNGCNI